MSAIKRVVSGSLASWLRIAVTIISQIVAVPIYINYWSIETYGIWMLVQSTVTFMTVFDYAHHQYLGNEFLKLGKHKPAEIGEVLCSGMVIAFTISIATFFTVCAMVLSGALTRWVGIEVSEAHDFEMSLLLTAGTWALTVTFSGLLGRVLYPFGYFPLSAWGGVVLALVSTLASILAVCMGADLITTTIVTCVVNLTGHSVLTLLLLRIAKNEKLTNGRLNIQLGFLRFFASMLLGLQYGLEVFRQQGVRFVLLPLSGIIQMTAFSTMRTGANLAQQGLATITAPLMPELMGFLASRDQIRTEVAFSVIWLMLCVVLVPTVLILQYLSPALFFLWTSGKIAFDSGLFGVLSLGVLVSALAQPSIAVVSGNNLLKPQFQISLIATLITVGSMYLMVPVIGIKGAAIALLLGEILSLVSYVYVANKWLIASQMQWPQSSFVSASLSLGVAAVGMASITVFKEHAGLALIVSLIVQGFVISGYWLQLPMVARRKAATQFSKILPSSYRQRLAKSVSDSD